MVVSRFQALSFRLPKTSNKILRSLRTADIMTDTSHPEHTSEVQSWYSMWQRAVFRKPNKKTFYSVNTFLFSLLFHRAFSYIY